MLHYFLKNKLFTKIFFITLFHIACLFCSYIYSPKTKVKQIRSYPSTKERFTRLNTTFSQKQQVNSAKINLPKREIKNTQNNNPSQNSHATIKNSSPQTITNKKNNSTISNTKKNKHSTELKSKFKELSKDLISQIDALESSSKQTLSLYEITEIENKQSQVLSSSEKIEHNNLLDEDIIDILKSSLLLPNPHEDIIFLLSLSPKGNLLSLKIEKSNSIKNSEYCIKEIPKLSFQNALQKYNLKQNILFRIKLTT